MKSRVGNSSTGLATVIDPIVFGTLDVYRFALTELRPTPSCGHYTFNMRDVCKLIHGICLCSSGSPGKGKERGGGGGEEDDDEDGTGGGLIMNMMDKPGASMYARLWVHEACRVVGDRLVNEMDNLAFVDCLAKVIKRRFDTTLSKLLQSVAAPPSSSSASSGGGRRKHGSQDDTTNNHILIDQLGELYFGDYSDVNAAPEDRRYQVIDASTAARHANNDGGKADDDGGGGNDSGGDDDGGIKWNQSSILQAEAGGGGGGGGGGSGGKEEDEDVASSRAIVHSFHGGAAVTELFEAYLTSMNALASTSMDLVLFDYAVRHISRVARVLALPGAHALLIGMGGSGRMSATKVKSLVYID